MMKTKFLVMLLALIMLSTAADVDAYNVYYGQLHSHTKISDGTGTPLQAYEYARDVAGLDFFSIADHDYYPNDMKDKDWATIKEAANSFNEDGTYTTFWGFEWTSDNDSYHDGLLERGHMAIINSDDYCIAWWDETNELNEIVDWMSTRNCVAFFNHPGSYGFFGMEFPFDTYSDKIVGMELWNRSTDFYSKTIPDPHPSSGNRWYDEALRQGFYIGAGGSGDNHSANWGTQNEWRMAILAEELTRDDLLAAMKARRFYSARDKNLVLSFTCNDAQMGSLIADGVLNVAIEASDGDGEIFTKIELLKNGAVIETWTPNETGPFVTTTVSDALHDDYFYVIAYQGGGWEAISSPIYVISVPDDTTPPTPAPTFVTPPYATSDASIAMEASVAYDEFYSVLYNFTCTAGGGNDSGWQAETFYEDTGLEPGTTYTYTVTARDTSTAKNETAPSTSESATTEVDDSPPTPNPMTWAIVPYATGDSSIAMTATEATDDYGVQYNFDETSGNIGGDDSGWQDSPVYVDTGLTPDTEYTYTVTARDTSTAKNETVPSASASATTDPEDTVAPTPDPMTWNSAPDGTSTSTISMTATTASDTSGVEYSFTCTAGGGHDSGWQDSSTYEDTGLMYGTQYTYAVKARDTSLNYNETASSEASATTLTGPALWTSKAVYAPGEDIVVNFVNAAGNSEDWIGLYVDGTSDESYLTYKYLGDPSGSITFVDNNGDGDVDGLPGKGAYEARLFFRGSYKLEAFFDFTVADTTPPTLEAPSDLSATAISTTEIYLSWTDNANDETGFKIERSERVNTAFAQIDTVGADVTSYSDTGLRKGTTYYYRVRATNASGDSTYSNEINVKTLKR